MPKEAEPNFLFGCDPEMFIHDENNELVSAAGLIPGTKQEPYKVEFGAVQVDGMAAEINIDPVNNFYDFNRNIGAVLKQLRGMLPTGHGLLFLPAVNFPEKVFAEASDEAKALGCDPDYNAWTGLINDVPDTSNDPTLRTAAGHLHVGWTTGADVTDESHFGHCRDLTKQFDYFLGGWSLRMDSDNTRRCLYGRAGAFRPKPYGMEYRVLSNFWVSNRERRATVWNRMQIAIEQMRKNFLPERYNNEVLIESINSGDGKELAAMYPWPTRSAAL